MNLFRLFRGAPGRAMTLAQEGNRPMKTKPLLLAGLLAAAWIAPAAAAPGQLELKTLSNRADLISGGNALVEVLVPATSRRRAFA